jgi:DNA-binding transcriptional regulator YhcF (GntR family)
MKQYGHIKLPRSINLIEGRNKGAKRTLLRQICTDAEYCDVEHPTHGKIERGAMVTSLSQLCEDTGVSLPQVRRALSDLVAEGYITIEATARYSKITVIWDDFVQLRDNNIMLNNTVSRTVSRTQSSKAETLATVEDSASYNDCGKKVAKQVAKQVAHEVANIVINNKENNNTHTENIIYPVKDLKAQAHARDTHAHTYTSHTTHPQVEEVVEWMSNNTPELLAMVKPFSDAALRQIVEEYTMDEIRTILLEMWSNGVPWRKLSAAVEFRKYARAHKQFRERFTTEQQPAEKLYTYDEMADYVWKNRVSQSRYFQMVEHNGKMMYRKIC